MNSRLKCLAVMAQGMQSGEPVLISKHGKPVAKLVSAALEADDLFG